MRLCVYLYRIIYTSLCALIYTRLFIDSRALFASGPGEASWFDKVKGAEEAGMAVTHVVGG